MPASRKRAEREEREPCECPVCFEEFEASGPRTKVRPFLCEGGIAHVICSACDKTLYVRHDDRCPVCRAGRSGTSVQRNGARPSPMSLPSPMGLPMGLPMGILGAGLMSGQADVDRDGGANVDRDFLSWLPRRIGAGSHEPASSSTGAYGGNRSFMARFRAASASRHSRTNQVVMLHNPVSGISILDHAIDLTDDDEAVAPTAVAADEADTSADATLAMLLSDEGVGAALDGLCDPTRMTAGQFAAHVSARQADRPRALVADQAR